MADLIRLNRDLHAEAEELLPWYVTGQLDAADRAKVESHLGDCPDCQRQLKFECRLSDEIREMSPVLDASWEKLRAQIEDSEKRRVPVWARAAPIWRAAMRPPATAFLAAQLAILGLFVVMLPPMLQRPGYHALSSATAPASANLIVMFRPDTTEQQLRATLDASGARLVGGPTDANAFLLHVEPAARAQALVKLRANREVSMAQPID